MRIALHLHQPVDADGAGPRDAADVVAAEVDQHHVLGALLQVAEQLSLEPRVFGRVGASPARAGERPGLDTPAFDLHELLGRGAHHVAVASERQKEHVWRWVDGSKASVHVERAGREVLAKTLRDHDLERIAGQDVLARRIDHGVELPAGHIGLPLPSIHAAGWRSHRV